MCEIHLPDEMHCRYVDFNMGLESIILCSITLPHTSALPHDHPAPYFDPDATQAAHIAHVRKGSVPESPANATITQEALHAVLATQPVLG